MNSLNLAISKLKNVESYYNLNSELLLVKIKNAKVNFLTRLRDNSRHLGPTENNKACYGRYSNALNLVKLEDYFKDTNSPSDYFSFDAYVEDFSENTLKDYDDKNVYIMQYNSRYYHIILDILPKLLYLKNIDPNFHLILLSSWPGEKIEKSGMFYGLEKDSEREMLKEISKEEDGTLLRYWLDVLGIEFTCHNADSIKQIENVSFKNMYLFYEKRFHLAQQCEDCFENYWSKHLKINNSGVIYDHYQHSLSHNNHVTIKDILFLSEYLNSKNTQINSSDKIYISRKNYARKHNMEDKIELYFNSMGYKTIYFEDYSQYEQISICKNAKEIVCYLGSSLVNVMLSKTKATVYVIETEDKDRPEFSKSMVNLYSFLGSSLGSNMSTLLCEDDKDLDFIKSLFDNTVGGN